MAGVSDKFEVVEIDNTIDQDLFLPAKGEFEVIQTDPDFAPDGTPSSISGAESFLRGASQGATLGFQDEAGAFVEKGIAAVDKFGREALNLIPGVDLSTEVSERVLSRDTGELIEENRVINREAQQENPETFLLGDLSGGVVSTLPIGAAGTAVKAAKTGAALGATTAVGRSEDKVSLEGAANTLFGAAGGAFLGAAAKVAGDKVGKVFRHIFGTSSDDATRAATQTTKVGASGTKGGEAEVIKQANNTIKNQVDDFVSSSKVPPTKTDVRAAKIIKADPDDVAFYRANKARIDAQDFSLDEGAPNSLSSKVIDDIETIQTTLDTRRELGAKLIEESSMTTSNQEIKNIFDKKISSLRSSKKALTDSGRDAIKYLKGLSDRLVRKGEAGEEIIENWSAVDMKEYIRGLWDDNQRFLNSRAGLNNTKPDLAEKALGEVTSDINTFLKQRVGPEYGKVMDQMHGELKVLEKFQNMTKVNNWFKNRFVKPLEDRINGVSTERSLSWNQAKNWVNTIAELEQITGTPYVQIVKDQIVFGRLFPEVAKGGQRGSFSSNLARAVKDVATGNVRGAVRETAEAGGGVGETVRKGIFNRLITKQSEGTATATDKIVNRFAKGVETALGVPAEVAERGGSAAAVNHFVLMKRDPQYRKKFFKAEETEAKKNE